MRDVRLDTDLQSAPHTECSPATPAAVTRTVEHENMQCRYGLLVIELSSTVLGSSAGVRRALQRALEKHGIQAAAYELPSVAGLPVDRATASLLPTGMNLVADNRRSHLIVAAWIEGIQTHFAMPSARQPIAQLGARKGA